MTPDDVRMLINRLSQGIDHGERLEQFITEIPMMEDQLQSIMNKFIVGGRLADVENRTVYDLTDEQAGLLELVNHIKELLYMLREIREAYHQGGPAAVEAWSRAHGKK